METQAKCHGQAVGERLKSDCSEGLLGRQRLGGGRLEVDGVGDGFKGVPSMCRLERARLLGRWRSLNNQRKVSREPR